jgi:predicted S18 family serine protease
MKEAIENAVKLLAEKINENVKADDALKFTQSALNLEHVLAVQGNIAEQEKRMLGK